MTQIESGRSEASCGVRHIPLRLADERLSVDATIVRSWCTCDLCGETRTGKRWASFTDIPTGITATSVAQSGSRLSIEWSDGHHSQIDLDTIATTATTNARSPLRSVAPSVFATTFTEATGSKSGIHRALDALASNGVVHVTGGPRDAESTAAFAELFGPVHVTSYGKVQVFITSPNAHTAAHTGVAQHPHTDEPFRYSPPGYLFFHSIVSGDPGEGTSLLVDGFAAAELLRETDPAAFATLSDLPVLFHRQHDGEVRFASRSRVISLDDRGEIQAIRLNMRCLAPIDPRQPKADEIFHAITAFSRIVEEPTNQTSLHLNAGDFLIFDNNRIMHGRTAFSDSSERHLQSCHVDKDGIHSTYRLLSHELDRPTNVLQQGPVT